VTTVRGKSLKATAFDIAEGYIIVNPLFLKSIENESLRGLYQEIAKAQIEIRGEKFPHGDPQSIRSRNIRLQRLNSALVILRNFARERKIVIV
jgi:hypothetical protein